MNESEPQDAPIGFLTAVELNEIGWCGGLLLLNDRGRPLEFHCNAPIRPSRAQAILYGAALRTLLLGDTIALGLIEKCSRPPAAILTDLAELWNIQDQIRIPLGLVALSIEQNIERIELAEMDRWSEFLVEKQRVASVANDSERSALLKSAIEKFAKRLPLFEPFQRIRNAIAEAQSSARWRDAA